MRTDYKTILFIEDESLIADLYAAVLRSHGFTIDCAYDGASGLTSALSNNYDLILLDLMLPNMSGEDLLSTLRDKTASPQFDQTTDIFVLTNFEEDSVTKTRLLALAQRYLVKVEVTPLALVKLLQSGAEPQAEPL